MPSSYTLGKYFEDFVQAQLASGRYGNASEVLRDALRLMEDRERRHAPPNIDAGGTDAINLARAMVSRYVPADAGLADELIRGRHAAAARE